MKTKRILSAVMSIVLGMSMVSVNLPAVTDKPITATAADDEINVWDGTYDTSWYDDEETEFHLTTPEQLAGLAKLVYNSSKNFSDKTVYLDNDIYLNKTDDQTNKWIPIGIAGGYYFKGTFNGQDNTIYNLYIDSKSSESGLFGYCSGSISNLNMDNVSVSSSNIHSYAGGICGEMRGDITNCSVSGSVFSSSSSSDSYAGGICGHTTGNIYDCSVSGSVSSSSSESSFMSHRYVCAGGICGYSEGNISNSSNNAIISSYSPYSQEESYSGGICGRGDSVTITDCYNVGIIEKGDYSGGILGYAYEKEKSVIKNVYNAADVTGSKAGAIVGRRDSSSTIENAYYLNTTAANGVGIGSSGNVNTVSKSKANMQKETFAETLGDAFVYVPDDYPKLTWETSRNNAKFDKDSLELDATNKQYSLKLTTTYSGEITWLSTNPSVATVDKNGTVTAVSDGETEIYAVCGESTAKCNVKVKFGYYLSETETDINEGDTYKISVLSAATDEETENKFIFSSSDEKVATVDEKGTITAVSEGKCTVTAEFENTKLVFNVTVKHIETPTEEKKTELDNSKLSVGAGKEATIKVKNYSGSVTWISADTKIASVTQGASPDTAIVTGISGGNVKIYAILGASGNLVCDVTVTPDSYITGDINSDGKVNIADATSLQKYLLGTENFTEKQYKLADMNGDGSVDVFDMVLMRQQLIKK